MWIKMTKKRMDKLTSLTKKQIIGSIQDDIDGGEHLMKEVWEQCDSDEEYLFIIGVMTRIINLIKREI